MTFDAARGTGPLAHDALKAKPQEFVTLDAALEAATRDAGDELVVEYQNDMGETRYAVLDVDATSAFDPSALNFAEAGVTMALSVDEQVRKGVGAGTYNQIRNVFQDKDLDRLTESTLSLAKAATTRVQVSSWNDGYIRGFRAEGGNTHWNNQVKENRAHVLQTVGTTIGQLDAQLIEIDKQLRAAEKAGDAPLVATLQQTLQARQTQRTELATYQEILGAELLTDPRDPTTAVPGVQRGDGTAVTVGAARSSPAQFRAVIDALVQRRAGLLAQQGDPPDASVARQISSLDGAISSLTSKHTQIWAAEGDRNRRLMSLARIGEQLDASTKTLENIGRQIAQAPVQAGGSSTVAACRKQLDAEIVRLVGDNGKSGVLGQLVEAYARANGKSEAVALLKSQMSEIHTLHISGTADADALIAKLNGMQAGLIGQLEKMAKIQDGITMKEVGQLKSIDRRVDGFRAIYSTNQTQLDNLQAEISRTEKMMADGYYRGPTRSEIATLKDAQKWTPGSKGADPFAVNQTIVGYYLDAGRRWRDLIGADVATWPDFAAHACNGAGKEIATLMTARSAVATMMSVNLNGWEDDDRAAAALAKMWDDPKTRTQLQKMLGEHAPKMAAAMDKLRNGNLVSAFTDMRGFANEFLATVDSMLTAFVTGNTEIAANILAADQVFWEALGSGKKPSEALSTLRQEITSGKIADPSGMLIRGYNSLVTATETAQSLRRQGKSAEEVRQAVSPIVLNASLGLGWQEQSTFLQTDRTFGEANVERTLKVVSEGMTLDLPDGQEFAMVGDWQDLSVRMGANLHTGPAAAKQFANSLSPSEWQDAKRINPNLPQRDPGAKPPTDAYWVQLKIQPNQVIYDDQGKKLPPGTIVFFECPIPPKSGTAADMFASGTQAGDMQNAVLKAPKRAEAPGHYHTTGGIDSRPVVNVALAAVNGAERLGTSVAGLFK